MHPIKEFKFDTIAPKLEEEYFKIHNQIINDLILLKNKISHVGSEKYLDVFLSRFKKVVKVKNTVPDTIIGCSRNVIMGIHDKTKTDINTLEFTFDVVKLIDTKFSKWIFNELGNRKNNNVTKISLKDLIMVIFNYDENRQMLLHYYTSINYSVCSYCLVQSTIIYESATQKKYYLTGNLDHVKPKDKNPFLSISINNLIPVCGPCNQRKSATTFIYDPFDIAHAHSFDFNDCIDYDEDKGEVIYKSLKELKIIADDEECMDMSKKLDYIDLYSNFDTNAEILVERFKKFNSEGYNEHLNKNTDSSNTREMIEYLISEIPLTDDNILKYPLTKFKMDLFNTIKSKSSTH
jgi:5-methylcytosine-specific restriction endonuclease McrA